MRQEADKSQSVKQRQRDPERTRQEILDVATEEFSERGLAGARVDEIANRTRTTKRMIYYYFGSKEDLYRAVLQRAYDQVRINIEHVDVESVDPVTAVRRLTELMFDRSDANRNFTRLVSQENMQRGRYISPPSNSRGVNLPVIRMLESALQRGRAQGVFVRDIDAVDLHMLIGSFCFFRVNNQYTFEANYGRNLVEPTRRDLYRQRVGDVVIAYLTNASS